MLLPFHPWARNARGVRASASEGRSESDRAERQNACQGLELSLDCGPGQSSGDRGLRERNRKIFPPVRRELLDQAQVSGSVGACGVGPCVVAEPSIGAGSLARENRKHWVLSGKPARFAGERLWMDYGLVRLRERKRSCAAKA